MSNGTGGQPTLEEVAARAGVGRGTVSRVVNGSPQVSERTRVRVMRAVDELGYVPNMAARALVTRRTGAIALVISEPEERIFGEPFFAGRGPRHHHRRGRGLAPARAGPGADPRAGRPARHLPHAAARRRGADALGPRRRHRCPSRIQGRGLPIVLCGRPGQVAGDELCRRRQHRGSPRGGGPPGRQRPRRRRPHRRTAGHDRRSGPPRRLPRRPGGRRARGRGLARRGRRLQRGQRRGGHARAAGAGGPTSTRSSRPAT